MPIAQRDFYLPFIKKEKLAEDTYSFYFKQENHDFNFLPGQYIRMTLPIKNVDSRGNSRPFTISSSPLEKNHIMITTKIIESSFKKKMVELMAGEKVKFFGPLGGFVFKDNDKENKVFLAGGIGITPFYSMITYASAKKLSIPITLLVSFSIAEDIFWHKELQEIAANNSSIRAIYTVSRPEEFDTKWNGQTGRISEALIKKYVSNILKPQYFIVGPPAMVAAIEGVVRNMGVENEKIFIENFTGY